MRTLGLYQPYATAMLHGKIETRAVRHGYKPPFPTDEYLIYSCKKAYDEKSVEKISGEQFRRMVYFIQDDETLDLNGYALCTGRLAAVRLMTKRDEDETFVKFPDSGLIFRWKNKEHSEVAEYVLWCLIFENVRAIEPFEFKHGHQGVGFVEDEDLLKIKYL